ncbi:MAG: hypothetical protein ACR2KX_02060 [Chitinophagaceae bacterium]
MNENIDWYGKLIGNWEVEVIDYFEDGTKTQTKGEWYFSRILEGRAIQDIFISPKRNQKIPDVAKVRNRCGTTIRFYDPNINCWKITWFNPLSNVTNQLVAKKIGSNIIQEGIDAEGNIMRWSFVKITENSFQWSGEISTDGGETFTLKTEIFGKIKNNN